MVIFIPTGDSNHCFRSTSLVEIGASVEPPVLFFSLNERDNIGAIEVFVLLQALPVVEGLVQKLLYWVFFVLVGAG